MNEELAEARREAHDALTVWRESLPNKRYRSWLRMLTNGLKSTIDHLSIEECREVVRLVSGAEESVLDWDKVEAAREECRRGRPSNEAQALCVRAFYANPLRYLELTEEGVRSVKAKRSSVKATKVVSSRRKERQREQAALREALPHLYGPPGKPKPKGQRLLREVGLLDRLNQLRGRGSDPTPEKSVLDETLESIRGRG